MNQHPLTYQCRQAMYAVLKNVTQTPGGYLWWYGLPSKGRHSQRILIQKWTSLVATTLFPQNLLAAMLQAALSPQGTVDSRGKLLYNWLLKYVYKGKVDRLYKDWLLISKFSNNS